MLYIRNLKKNEFLKGCKSIVGDISNKKTVFKKWFTMCRDVQIYKDIYLKKNKQNKPTSEWTKVGRCRLKFHTYFPHKNNSSA